MLALPVARDSITNRGSLVCLYTLAYIVHQTLLRLATGWFLQCLSRKAGPQGTELSSHRHIGIDSKEVGVSLSLSPRIQVPTLPSSKGQQHLVFFSKSRNSSSLVCLYSEQGPAGHQEPSTVGRSWVPRKQNLRQNWN